MATPRKLWETNVGLRPATYIMSTFVCLAIAGVRPISRKRERDVVRSSMWRGRSPQIIAIGASTGGPQALEDILTQLPAEYPIPILCVQHISTGFLDGLVH